MTSMYLYRLVDETAVQHKKKKMNSIHYAQLQRTSLERTIVTSEYCLGGLAGSLAP